MAGSSLTETVLRSSNTGKVVLDLALLVLVFGLLWIFFRRKTVVFLTLFVLFIIFYSLEEVLSAQRVTVKNADGVQEVAVVSQHRSPFHLGFRKMRLVYGSVCMTGGIQLFNLCRGDRRYQLTKTISATLTTNLFDQVTYRSYLKGPLPKRVIFICQHVKDIVDIMFFNTFVPDTHCMTVMNDWNVQEDLAFVGYHLFFKHLYGAYMLNLRDRKRLKSKLIKFASKLTKEGNPEVFCIWAAGHAWDARYANGVKSFKPGAFYMSVFTQTPVCIVHGRNSQDFRKLVVEQSDLIYPPPLGSSQTDSYIEFYNDVVNREPVEGFCREVEMLYRRIDDGLAREVS